MTSAAVQTAVDKDGLFLPLIDFSLFLRGNEGDKAEVAKGMADGFKTAGFVYLKNHGISDDTVKNVFAESAGFFARSLEQKESLKWTTPESNRGYVASGREKLSESTDGGEISKLQALSPDLKESMEIGREGEPGNPNNWPDQFDDKGKEFTKTMKQFFLTCKELHVFIMRSIAIGMGLKEDFFDEYTDGGYNNLRLLHYPSAKKELFREKGHVRANQHSDYGSITLLFQDNRGGLQVQSPNGTFVDATPIPGTIVINAGDLLNRWSNNIIKSTVHRVVEPPLPAEKAEEIEEYPPRYSVAYFCNPNFDKMIEALPGTYAEGKSIEEGGKKYDGILSGDYLTQRLSATYVK